MGIRESGVRAARKLSGSGSGSGSGGEGLEVAVAGVEIARAGATYISVHLIGVHG